MENSYVRVESIHKSFYGVHALKNVNLEINTGEVRTLMGENGSGKSTLIKIIAGVYKKDSGNIYINEQKFDDLTPRISMNNGIQIIYQDFSLFPNLTVAENIAISDQITKKSTFVNWNEMKKLAEKALNKIGLNLDVEQKIKNLSMADKQLVSIARVLLYDTKIIIMDEPTTTLTYKEVNRLFEVIKELKKKGIGILFVSHKLNEVFEISDKMTILRNGEKVFDGSTKELNQNKVEYYMTGKNLNKIDDFDQEINKRKSLFNVSDLSKKGKFDEVSFSVKEGEILGITGLLGCGRTDLALSLFGLEPYDKGEVVINNNQIDISSPQDAINSGIGYVPEDRVKEGLVLEKPVKDNMVASIIDRISNKYHMINFNKLNKIVDSWIDIFNIKLSSKDADIKSLSGGNQQKVLLAKWMAIEPDILVLNGPTVGVDVGAKSEIYKFLREFAQKNNKAVILISDDIPELTANCRRILVMKDGKIEHELDSQNVSEDDIYNILIED